MKFKRLVQRLRNPDFVVLKLFGLADIGYLRAKKRGKSSDTSRRITRKSQSASFDDAMGWAWLINQPNLFGNWLVASALSNPRRFKRWTDALDAL